MKFSTKILLALSCLSTLSFSATIGTNTPFFQFEAVAPSGNNTPFVETFSASNAPNAAFYNGLPTLQSRITVPSKYANQVMYSFATSTTPAGFQFGNNEVTNPNIRNYQGWNATQSFVYFGGYYGEGEVLIPSPGMIYQAHQNGVPIYACIFLNENYTPEQNWVNNKLSDANYVNNTLTPALVAMAKTYHFDGYFINNECGGNNNNFQLLANNLLNQGISVDWYYVRSTSNMTSNQFNSNYYICADMGVNSVAYANVNPSLRNNTALEQDIAWSNLSFANAATTAKNYPQNHVAISLFGANFKAMNTSSATVNQPNSLESEFLSYNLMNQLVSSVDQYIPSTGSSFITTFNTGAGSNFFISGGKTTMGAWSDTSDADLAPSLAAFNSKYYSIDYSKAWLGGSSIKVSTNNQFVLYNTNFTPDNQAYVVVYYQGTLPNGAAILLNNTSYTITNTQTLSNNWSASIVSLNSAQAGIPISSISLKNCSGINIGKIYVGDSTTPSTISSITTPSSNVYAWSPVSNNYLYLCYDASGNFLAGTKLAAFATQENKYVTTTSSVNATVNPVAKVTTIVPFNRNNLQY